MSDDIEPGPGKKHRIIHWNPDAGNDNVRRRWTLPRILLTGFVGFFALLFAAGGVIRVIKAVKPGAFEPAPVAAVEDPVTQFRNQNDANLALSSAKKAIESLRRMPFQDHPKQMEKFFIIEKDFNAGSDLVARGDYSKGYTLLQSVNDRIAEFSLSIQTKQEAQNLQNAFILRIRELDNARNLAPDALNAANLAAADSNRLLTDGDFLLAKRVIERGMGELKKAEEALANKVQENIWAGQQALLRGDRQAASNSFRAALETAPDSESAKQGLKRAETIDRVHALILRAKGFEDAKEYAQAADAYKSAFELDAFSAEAQQGQSRAKRLETETKFDNAYKAVQDAFAAKDWEKAIVQAKAALAVNPQKTEVGTMLKTAQENQHNESVQKALKRGSDAADRYDWLAAKAAYEDAQKLDPKNVDATEGVINASQVIRALKAYETQINAAEEYAARNDFQAAIRAFNLAMQSKPNYLVAEQRTEQLWNLLQVNKDPVDVTFQSDEKTFVSIEGFQNLSTFSKKTLKILPGDYQIIGRRRGYKEVVIPIQVRGGVALPVISVICTVRDTSR